jgi:GT2 family glycosyltransferase
VNAQPVVSAVVVAHGDAPWLGDCVEALLASEDVQPEVVVVDNGSSAVERLGVRPGLEIVRPADNLGFAGGCNEGVEKSRGEVVALVNPDAIVEPLALARLATAAREPGVGVSTASLRLAGTPDVLNSGGNEVHFLGFGWAGCFGQPATSRTAGPVTAATGAAMALRREVWDALGGFDERYFMYHEDAELSLRSWQRGLRVQYVPEAVVHHHYEFGRHALKHGLLERNRLVLVLTLYQRRTLLLLAPALAAVEAGIVAAALGQGWLREKASGWWWLVRNRQWLRARRRQVQEARVVPDRELAHLFAPRLNPANYRLPVFMRPVEWLLARYWAAVRRLL